MSRRSPAEEAAAALARFTTVWGGSGGLCSMLADEYGCTLTCDEAEALAGLYTVAGKPGEAATIIRAHAEYDNEGDLHYGHDAGSAR